MCGNKVYILKFSIESIDHDQGHDVGHDHVTNLTVGAKMVGKK